MNESERIAALEAAVSELQERKSKWYQDVDFTTISILLISMIAVMIWTVVKS